MNPVGRPAGRALRSWRGHGAPMKLSVRLLLLVLIAALPILAHAGA